MYISCVTVSKTERCDSATVAFIFKPIAYSALFKSVFTREECYHLLILRRYIRTLDNDAIRAVSSTGPAMTCTCLQITLAGCFQIMNCQQRLDVVASLEAVKSCSYSVPSDCHARQGYHPIRQTYIYNT